ncbi:MAG: hypothetical protein E7630_02190 [Ruminococcaceae bacterium]|nr:hypothetical protein [Oscillospiraceae bacterium]
MNDSTPASRPRRITAATAILCSLAAVTVGAVVLLTCLLVTHRRDFRNASDYRFVEKWLSEAADAVFYEAALPFFEAEITPYEEETAAKHLLAEALKAEKLSFSRADAYTDESPVYTLFLEGKDVFTLTLANRGNGPSGYPRWEVASLALSPICALGDPLTLEVPKGASVTVNGTALDASSAETVPYFALTAFEAALSDTYSCQRYLLGRFFGEPTVTVSFDGKSLPPDALRDGVLYYPYPSSYTTALSLTVPYGAAVTVNSVPLSGEAVMETKIPYPALTRFEVGRPEAVALRYSLAGLFETPDVEVRCGETVLTESEAGLYLLPEELTKTMTVLAPDYATVKLNGIPLGEADQDGEPVDLPILEGVTKYAKKRPHMIRYQVSGLLALPSVTAVDADGNPLLLCSYRSAEGEAFFLCSDDGTIPDKELLTLKTFAHAYVTYTYSGISKLTTHYNTVVSMTPAKTPAFSKLKAAYQDLYKADVHTDIQFGHVEALHYTVFSDSAYGAVLKIPFTSRREGEALSHTVIMEVLYVYSGGVRLIANYQVLDTVSESVNEG